MASSIRPSKGMLMTIFLKRSCLFVSLCTGTLSANPQNPTVVHGEVSFNGLTTPSITIHANNRAIINWEAFSIGENETIQFIQTDVNSAVLNRVTGSLMSQIYGRLQADGKVYLLNPNGILFDKNAIIDVGSLIASSFDLSNDDFLKEGDLLFVGDSTKLLRNEGKVTAKNGDIILLAHRIENSGTLSAKEGSVVLGAGHRILVSVKGKNSLFIELPGDGVINEGKIEALKAVVETHANPISLGIQNKGSLNAFHLEEEDGEIYLRCRNSFIQNEGTLAASGNISIETEDADILNYGQMDGAKISIQSAGSSSTLAERRPVSNFGAISAKSIAIHAPKFENSGTISGIEEVVIFAPGNYIETQSGTLSSDGGSIRILAGNYFSSGIVSAKGGVGGEIEIEAEQLFSIAARFDASGKTIGGKVTLTATSQSHPLTLNEHVVVDVSASDKGGAIEINSLIPIYSMANFNCEGNQPGNLLIPSTIATEQKIPKFFDPNPHEESLLWRAFSAANSHPFWQIWDQNTEFAFRSNPSTQLAACPPVGIELVDPNPTGSFSSFGNRMQILPNGNIVVDKVADDFGGTNAGAIYLYNGFTGALISALRGSTVDDRVSFGGFIVLTNGNYVVISQTWRDGNINPLCGAVTFCNAATGVNGPVSAANSLVGTTTSDQAGASGVIALANGNYAVGSFGWGNGIIFDQVGAVTLGNGVTGISGPITTANSLYGTTTGDQVGSNLTALTNGNYVVNSPFWNNGVPGDQVGAATLCNGTTPTTGPVTTTNSLHGTTQGDQVAFYSTALANGNYVVASINWNNGVPGSQMGAATFGNGTTGITGPVTTMNSLHGTNLIDQIANQILPLVNGNYVVQSFAWNDGIGAATFGNGTTGITGPISAANSLIGSTGNPNPDVIGAYTIALANGNYVTSSPSWNNTTGAVTFGNGTTGISGVVSGANSLVGTLPGDNVGFKLTALTNGNYVASTPYWDNGGAMPQAGAATFGNGTTGITGPVTPLNSLVGTTAFDRVAFESVTALSNGNYVVKSPSWSNGGTTPGAGAATFGNGTTGIAGPVTTANSLYGTTQTDGVGAVVIPLSNGNYAVASQLWNDGVPGDFLGAVTFGNGTTGITGPVTSSNSIVGAFLNDNISNGDFLEISNEYFILSPNWNSDTGAVTPANSSNGTFCDGTFGAVSPLNSFIGLNTSSALELGVSSFSNNIVAVQFSDNAGQTRIYIFIPPPPPIIFDIPPRGIHDFAVAITQPFTIWNYYTLKGNLEGSSIYPPMYIYKELPIYLPSLVTHEPFPKLTYK